MVARKITKEAVDGIKPGRADAYLWDSELKGFGLKITPAGRKVYLVQYRLGGRSGKTRRVTIGTHGSVAPDQARRMARQILGNVASGIDVAAERHRRKADDRQAPTIEVAAQDFLALHVRPKLKPRTGEEYERLINRLIVPQLGKRRIRDLSHGEVEHFHHGLKATPFQANRAIAVLAKLMTWTIKAGYRPDRINPVKGLERYREYARERFLSEAELAALGTAIRDAEEEKRLSPWGAAMIRLLVLTGCRFREILTLKWEHVDLATGVLRLPDSKTGRKVVLLSAPAMEVLAALPRLANNPHVIPGDKPGMHRVDLKKPWAFVSKRAGLVEVRLHDLRHTNASLGAASGLSLPLIGALLGHKQAATTQRYAHLSNDPLRQAAELIGERAARAMDGKSLQQSVVVPLKREG